MIDKVNEIIKRHKELEAELADPEVVSDISKIEKLNRKYRSLGRNMPVFQDYRDTANRLDQAREVLASESDPELATMARDEIAICESHLAELGEKVKLLLVPRDPDDAKNAIMEVRAGTGGVEAGIFAADLYRMYTRYAENQRWAVEVMNSSYGDLDSIKEVVFMVSGPGAYGALKYESGVHRVQRVPQTEAQGRIHTSAASVAVFPEADEVELSIDPNDLRIDVYRSGGHGGQHVNTTDSAVRIVHVPTGLTVICQDEKSQHKNKAKAMKVLQSRLYDQMTSEQKQREAQARKSMVSTGDRSVKIRTYNFPQNRVTDHRINVTLYKLEDFINGDIQELVSALEAADMEERLRAFTVGGSS
jgi:peptide chain release factor 1